MTTTRGREPGSTVRITRTRIPSGYNGDEIRVYFSCGRRRSWVDLRLKDFSEASLKAAIGERLSALFSQDRARSYVGRSFGIEEILKEAGRESRKDWWLDW